MKKLSLKKMASLIIAGIMAVSMAACTKDSGDKDMGALEKLTASGKLAIGTSADFPPYEFHKEINGKDTIVGFDIALAQAIADELGLKLEIKDMDFDGLLTALNAGTVDMVVAGMNPTAERALEVDFTKIYYTAEQTVLVKAENKDKYTSAASLAGLKVAAQKGTIQADLVAEQIENADIVALAKIPDLVMQLKSGMVEAIAVENAVAESYAKANPDLAVATFQFEIAEDEKGAAIAVKKGSEDLIEKLNEILDKLIADGKIDQFVVEANEMVE